MPRPIPHGFNAHTATLDANEQYIRDVLRLQILNWARFRHTIHIGNDPNNLHSNVPISQEVKETYIEFAKSHYEVITALGCVNLSMRSTPRSLRLPLQLLMFKKSVRDFYFHVGRLLDNLARLIYIINDPQSATEMKRIYGGTHIPMRHWIDWGSLRDYTGYVRLKKSRHLREIINMRNVLTHSWTIPVRLDRGMVPYWPLALRRKRDPLWPYAELAVMLRLYRTWDAVPRMMRSDFEFIEDFQNEVFGKLVRDVRKFERNTGVEIR